MTTHPEAYIYTYTPCARQTPRSYFLTVQ